jgi:hypothetical protein
MNAMIDSSNVVDQTTARPAEAPAASDANQRSALADSLPAMPRIPSRKFYRQ